MIPDNAETRKMLWDAASDLSDLASDTVLKVIDISTKMLIKHDLMGKISIPMIAEINKQFLRAHNITSEKMLKEKTEHALYKVNNTSMEDMIKTSLEPEFQKFCKDMGFKDE